jgi:hypothetical protein
MDKTSPEAIRVIKALGGTFAVAKLCGIKPPSVSDWKKHGIPDARLQYFRLLRPELFGQVTTKKRKAA